MTMRNVGIGALVGGLLTAALAGLTYFANRLVGLPFAPFELFDWMARVLPGPVITFGIDRMIDTMLFLGISVADSAKSAEQAIAILQFLGVGIVIGAAYFAVVTARKIRPDLFSGLVVGALFGLPLVAISIAIGQSAVGPVLRILWLLVVFLGWGAALSWACSGLLPAEGEGAAAPAADELRSAEQISRRRFLIRFGTATAAITVIGTGVGTLLAQADRRRLEAALSDSARKITQPTMTARSTRARRSQINEAVSMGRCPVTRSRISKAPWYAPQTTKVQAAPCHRPVIRKTKTRFRYVAAVLPRLPPSGM